MTGPDDESKPMTRTELAMLWDGLNQWLATHPTNLPRPTRSAETLIALIDFELAERFGG